MICTRLGCFVELNRSTREQTDVALAAAGWRSYRDDKDPPLASGTALCPEHVGDAPKFPPREKKGSKR